VFKYKTTVRISIDQQKCRKELFRIVKQSDKVHRFYYTGVLDIYCCKQFGKLAYRWKFSDDFFPFFPIAETSHIYKFSEECLTSTLCCFPNDVTFSQHGCYRGTYVRLPDMWNESEFLESRTFLATLFSQQDLSKEGRKYCV